MDHVPYVYDLMGHVKQFDLPLTLCPCRCRGGIYVGVALFACMLGFVASGTAKYTPLLPYNDSFPPSTQYIAIASKALI